MNIDYEQVLFWLWVSIIAGSFIGSAIYVLIRRLQGKDIATPQLISLLKNHNAMTITWLWKALEDGVITKDEADEFMMLATEGFKDILRLIMKTYDKKDMHEIDANDKLIIPEPNINTEETNGIDLKNETPPEEK